MSTKKAGGSTKNGRDSRSKRLGVKLYAGQTAIAGNILIRQKGNKFFAGEGVGTGKDFTLFALKNGIVKFTEKRLKKFDGRIYKDKMVNVVPATTVAKVKTEKPTRKVTKKVEKKVTKKAKTAVAA